MGPFDVEGWGVLEVVGSFVVEDPLSKKRGRALIPLDLLDGLGSLSFTASSGDRIFFLAVRAAVALSILCTLTRCCPIFWTGPDAQSTMGHQK